MAEKKRTVADLEQGPFHLAVVKGKKGTEAVTAGKVEIIDGKKKMIDEINSVVYGPDCEVPFFQKFQNKRM